MHGVTHRVRRFIDLRAPEIAERITERSIIVQPLGAIEQHGPHLPLSTDSLVATAVAEAAIDEVGDEVDAWLLPTLSYTKSNEHAWAPGTIWLSATTLLAVLDDIGQLRRPRQQLHAVTDGRREDLLDLSQLLGVGGRSSDGESHRTLRISACRTSGPRALRRPFRVAA